MKIILAPAKKMNIADDDFSAKGMPVYISDTKVLLEKLRTLDTAELKELWKCSDRLVKQNEQRIRSMDLYNSVSPAVFAYEGLAYQHMAPGAMDTQQLDYLQEHLRILSGFYGVLKPFDAVVPYRLEMQAVFPDGTRLYDFWGDRLYKALDDHVIVNLASKEYSDAVRPYLSPEDTLIDIVFGEKKGNKIVTKGTYAKMARGDMVWYMADHRTERYEDLKQFNEHFRYSEEDSSEDTYVFLAEEEQ